jgi:hypothetical protein
MAFLERSEFDNQSKAHAVLTLEVQEKAIATDSACMSAIREGASQRRQQIMSSRSI